MPEPYLIPEPRRDAVQAALHSAFGHTTASRWQPITGGVSGALILRFEVRGRSHVLRLEPERIALHHRQRGFACMTAAAAAGVAPPIRYADAAAGIAIMDFIPGRPLSEHPGGPVGLVRALGKLVTGLQALPPFPMLDDYPTAIVGMLTALSLSRFFAPGELDPHAAGLARIRTVLPWDPSSLVSAHNDPNPRNILFDGERVWLIDWELAFRNDPLVDLAILTTDLAETPELEAGLLEAAFGTPPTRRLRARLGIIRLLTRAYYGGIVLDSLAGQLRSAPDIGRAAESPAAFRAAIAAGRLASGSPDIAYAFGRMSLSAFADGVTAPGFEAMLSLAAEA
jgi:hypothetical protein